MTHQRQDARHRQRLPVKLAGTTLFTVNLCGGGFCTEILRVLSPGTTVEGVIRVRDREYPYSGRVAWSREGSPRMGVRGRMGIQFVTVASDFQAFLDSLPPAEPLAPGAGRAVPTKKP